MTSSRRLVLSAAAVIGALLFWAVLEVVLQRWVREIEVELEQ